MISFRKPRSLCFLALLTCAAVGHAQVIVPGPMEQLKAGESLVAPEIAPEGPVTILVSLPLQRAYVYRNGVPIAVTTVSTGKRGHETPVGMFTILQKDAVHRSNKYDDAPMPFMQRLTWDGVALHAGVLPGHPASHGCIRLPVDFARWLFSITRIGASVVVSDAVTVPEVSPSALRFDSLPDGHVSPTTYSWTPERAPTGPVSLVLSGRDRRIVVLRNGIEIGLASVTLDQPVTATSAYVLASIDTSGRRWMRLPLPGGSQPAAEAIGAERAGVHLPDVFRDAVLGILRPGATLLVTRDTLASGGTGTRVRVMDAQP